MHANHLKSVHLVTHIFPFLSFHSLSLIFLIPEMCSCPVQTLYLPHTYCFQRGNGKLKESYLFFFFSKSSLHLNINLFLSLDYCVASVQCSDPVELRPCLLFLGLTEIVSSDPGPTLSLFSYSVFPG